MSLKYISGPESASPLYIAALDSNKIIPEVEIYAWKGQESPIKVGSHYPEVSNSRNSLYKNGLVKLAEFIDTATAQGYRPVFYEPRPDAKRSKTLALLRGEDIKDDPSYRSLSFEELTQLRELQGLPKLKIAA